MKNVDSGSMFPLEERLVRAGMWWIEGHEVTRDESGWAIRFAGNTVGHTATLGAAREWIRENGR